VLLEVGHIARPHGLRGDVVVELVSTIEQRLAPGSTLECGSEQLVVQSAQLLPGRAGPRGGHWLVHFVGIASREKAEGLAGERLRCEPMAAAEGLWVHELIGAVVTEASGVTRGTVVAVEANPASDLLVLDTGALVPLRFVVGRSAGQLTVEVPPGLFEL
jgi:16S rRNA processing protein RimM